MSNHNGTTLYVENDDPYFYPRKKRYCGNKLSRSSFILLIILSLFVILIIICGLSLYFAIIPSMIRTNFAKIGDPKEGAEPLRFAKLNINGFNDSGFHVEVEATLPALVPWLPSSMKLLDPVFYIGSDSGKYVQLHVPDMDIKLNEPYHLDMGVQVTFVDNPGLRDYIKHVMNDGNKPNLIISSDLQVDILGYRSLAVQKVVDLNAKPKQVEVSSTYNGTIPEAIVASNPNGLIREKYPESKRIVLGSNLPDIVWEDFDLKMDDDGMNLNFLFQLENPTIATLNIPAVSFGLGVNLVNFIQISISPIVLDHGINDMKFEIGIKFMEIDENTGKSLGDLLTGAPLSINGPIVLEGASFAEQISADMKVGKYLKIKSEEMSLSNSSNASSLPNLPDSGEILSKSEIAFNLDDSGIDIPVSLILPRLLPLPPKVTFPASLTFGIFGTSVKTMDITIDPITIETTNDSMNIVTALHILPVNSDEAANSLAEAVNPIVSFNPSNSSVGLGAVKFQVGGKVLAWSESLLKSEKIDIPLSAVCIDCILSTSAEKSSSSDDGIPKPQGLSIAQLTDVSGFSINAKIELPKKTGIVFGVNVGYFGLEIQLQRKNFLLLDLPSGISAASDRSQVDVSSRLILSHEPSLATNLQETLNSIQKGDQSSILGITGIRLGTAGPNIIETFSKIVVELDAKLLHGSKLPSFQNDNGDSKAIGSLTAAELDIKSAHEIDIAFGASLHDIPVSLSIGSIYLNANLDNDKILSLGLSPLSFSVQSPSISLSASVAFTSGNEILSQKIGDLASKMLNSECLDNVKIVLSGITLSPAGISTGPAVIDQFKDVEIEIEFPKGGVSTGPLIDTSGFKESIKLSSFGLQNKGIDVTTLPDSVLRLSANMAYENKFPIKLSIPYFKSEVLLNEVPLVEPTLTGINLSKGAGIMSPRAHLFFQQHDISIQEHAANLFEDLFNKECVQTNVTINGLYFGGSDADKNDLFSKVKLDISKLLCKFKLPTTELLDSGSSLESPANGITLRKAIFQALPGKKLILDASVGLDIKSPMKAQVGLLQSGLSINTSPLLIASMRDVNINFGPNIADLDIGADLIFQENERTPREVVMIADAVQNNKSVESLVELNQFSIGYSETDKINTFSKVSISLPIEDFIKRYQNQRSVDNSSLIPDLGLQGKKLEVTFEPQNTVSASAVATAELPYNVSVSLPYLDARMGLDNIDALRSTFKKISLTTANVSGDMRLIFEDSEALESKLGIISDAILSEKKTDSKAVLNGIVLGYSEDDCIKAFSLIKLHLSIDSFTKKTSGNGNLMNAITNAYIDGIKIKNMDIGTSNGQLMKAAIELDFNNYLDVIINGLGHLAADIAIDSEPIVDTEFSGIQLIPGSNNAHIAANLHFLSSRESQIQVATLINDVLHKDPSEITQTVVGTGIEFGYSSDDYVKALRKVKIGIKAAKLLTKSDNKGDGGLNPIKALENLKINKNHVDMSQPGAIKIGLDVSLSNVTVPLSANIGYLGVSTMLEGSALAHIGIQNFIVSHNNANVDIKFDVQIDIPGGPDIKVKVAQSAKKIMENGLHNTTLSAKVHSLGIGASKNDLIDTFSLVNADLNPLAYLPSDTPAPSTASNRTVKVDVIYADVLDSRRLSAEVHARIFGFPLITLNIPYLGLASHMDGEELLEISATNIMLNEDGALTLNSVLYTHKNLNAAQKLAYIVGDILFHRPHPKVPNKMNMLSLRLGSSAESSIDILEYISLDAPMADMLSPIEKIQEKQETWIELIEMKSKISSTGLDASVVGKPFPNILPFAAKNKEAGATAKIGFGPNGTEKVVNIFFKDLFFTPGKPFTGNADIQVLVPEILPFLKQNVPNLFEWKDYDQNISVGWPVMTIGDPHNPSISFDPFDQIFMDAPPLFLWTPLTFVPKLVNPFENGLGMDIDIHVPNPGPLFADFGFLTTRMYHKGKEVATVTNPRPVIIKNKMNGGELFGTNIITLQLRMHLSKNPFKAWEELSDMIHNFKDYTVDIEASTPELGRVEWLSTCFNHVPGYMTGQIVPMLVSMLAHIKLKIGPWTITTPERFRRGAQLMLNKLDPEHIKIMGTEVEVDSDHFMAQGHVSTFSGVRTADQFDEWLRNEELDENTLNEPFNTTENDDVIRSGLNEGLLSDSSVEVR